MFLKNWTAGTKDKKYRVELWHKNKKIRTIQFGSRGMGQYKDKTPLKLYKHLDNNDPKRKKLYYQRHKKTYAKYSPDYMSKRFLW